MEQWLAPWLLHRMGVELEAATPLAGGSLHRAWCLQLRSGQRWFLKASQSHGLPMLQAEALGLQALAPLAAPWGLVVPQPLVVEAVAGQALLLMPWLALSPRPQPHDWQQLGAGLAQLHRASLAGHGGGYGWATDNFIGASLQRNGWHAHWPQFFAERRLGVQLELARRSGHHLEGADALLTRVPEWLAHHAPDPCLLHGDLWVGNLGVLDDGHGALFDPAVYRGDREVDLAMAHLFGGVPEAFSRGYGSVWPLPSGHRQRRTIYNLYHLLNHANLFGGGYWQQVRQTISSLLKVGPSG